MDEFNHDDVILWLLPHRGEGFSGAAFATRMPENKSRLVAARHDPPKRREIYRQQRGGTELPVEFGLRQNTDSLAVRFSHGARTSVGVIGGCAANADLCFQDILGISRYHFAITFDEQNRPIARDLGSTGGTKVTYNGEERERLSNFDWPLVGPSIISGKPPILNITDLVQFKVILPDHDYTSPEYIDKVKRFRTGTGDAENLFAALMVGSAQGTRLPSGQKTPSKGPRSRLVLYKEQIGRGTYGVVTYVWDLATREEYVVKQPLEMHIRNRKWGEKIWKKEAEIMQNVSHEHIVAFRGATFSPYPRLEFEYVSGGSLDGYTDLSTLESTQVLYQLSSALEYLHNRNPSIGHRDIKPENILVGRRDGDGIYVKFADFGLSKAADILKTCCGTLLWAAPEIYSKVADPVGAANNTYSVAVDIWSLGVVVASLECGLPEYEEEWKTKADDWIHAVQNHVKDNYVRRGSELLYLVMDSMLIEDADERSSADYINTEALKLLQIMTSALDGEGSATPKPSNLGTQSIVGSEVLDKNSSSTKVTNATAAEEEEEEEEEEEGEWRNSPYGESRPSQVLETTEGLLWNFGGPRGASFSSSDGSRATEVGTIEGHTKDAHEEEDRAFVMAGCLAGDQAQGDGGRDGVVASRESRSMRKRSWPKGNSTLSLASSFTHLPSADQHRTISQGRAKHKRNKTGG